MNSSDVLNSSKDSHGPCSVKVEPDCILEQQCSTGSAREKSSEEIFSSFTKLKEHYRPMSDESESTFTCQLCEQKFPSLDNLETHKLQCQVEDVKLACSESSSNSKAFKNNILVPENDEMYECNVCDKTFNLLSDIEEHMKFHDKEKPCTSNSDQKQYKCYHCDSEVFSSLKDLKLHVNLNHSFTKLYMCMLCKESCESTSELERHKCMYYKEMSYTCKICKQSFGQPSGLQRHNLFIHGIKKTKSYKCNYCLKSFSNLKLMKKHTGFYKKEKTYSCNFCKITIKCYGLLKQHIQSGHAPVPVKEYICDICNQTFDNAGNLEEHKIVHMSSLFTCSVCNEVFNGSNCLRNHMHTHTRVERLKCPHCEKTFANHCRKTRHIRTHTGERPYKCNQCDKTFKQETTLRSHKRVHTDDRPFVCNICDKALKTKYSLGKHHLTHSRDKSDTRLTKTTVLQNSIQSAEEVKEDSQKCNVKLETQKKSFSVSAPLVFDNCDGNCKEEITVKLQSDIKIEDYSLGLDYPSNIID